MVKMAAFLTTPDRATSAYLRFKCVTGSDRSLRRQFAPRLAAVGRGEGVEVDAFLWATEANLSGMEEHPFSFQKTGHLTPQDRGL